MGKLYKIKAKSQRLGATLELQNLQGDWGAQPPGMWVYRLQPLFFIYQTCTKYPLLLQGRHSEGLVSPHGWLEPQQEPSRVLGTRRSPWSWL